MFAVFGKYHGGSLSEWIHVDTFTTKEESEMMLAEYRLAFGKRWSFMVTEDWILKGPQKELNVYYKKCINAKNY